MSGEKFPVTYRISHQTVFSYDNPIGETVQELRMQPRTEGAQTCLDFQLKISPPAQVFRYQDYLGNIVHHFDIPGQHQEFRVLAQAMVKVEPLIQPDAGQSKESAWSHLDRLRDQCEHWDFLTPSPATMPTAALDEFCREIGLDRKGDPLSTLMWLSQQLYERLEYTPQGTDVDTPMDRVLATRKGVGQDFAHILMMIARRLGIPCRYVSGYLYQGKRAPGRWIPTNMHAWVEALLPGHGWIGVDPTNNSRTGVGHIRTAIGRDYWDVPANRGVHKGFAQCQLEVKVNVQPVKARPKVAARQAIASIP